MKLIDSNLNILALAFGQHGASVAYFEKGNLIKSLAVLNLERNNCIDEIDRIMHNLVENKLLA